MPKSSPETAFVKLTTGNHGSDISIRFDPQKDLWEVNLRPEGPGVGPIFYFGNTLMGRMADAYLTTHAKKTTEATAS